VGQLDPCDVLFILLFYYFIQHSLLRATASININITELWELGAQWGSGNLTNAGQSLALDSSSANAGDLVGVRIFYANDYLVCIQSVCRVLVDFVHRFTAEMGL